MAIEVRKRGMIKRNNGGLFDRDLKSWPIKFEYDSLDFIYMVDSFTNRNYWKRVWIMQELAAAKEGCIDVFIGEDSVPKIHLDLLTVMASERPGPERTPIINRGTYWESMELKLHILSLGDALKKYRGLECSDIRDRLYGLLSLLDHSTEPILPDYTISDIDLAFEICAKVGLDQMKYVLEAFEIDGFHPKVRKWVHERKRAQFDNQSLLRQGNARQFPKFTKLCARLDRDEDGNFVLPLQSKFSIYTEQDFLLDEAYCRGTGSKTIPDSFRKGLKTHIHDCTMAWNSFGRCDTKNYQCLYSSRSAKWLGDGVIGLLSDGVCAGDVLVPVTPGGGPDGFAIFLRHTRGQEYDVVGQVILNESENWLISPDAGFLAEVEMHFTDVDALTLMAQSLFWRDLGKDGLNSRLERLETVLPSGRVTIVPLGTDSQSERSERDVVMNAFWESIADYL